MRNYTVTPVHPSISALIDAAPGLAPYRQWLTQADAILAPPSVAMLLAGLQQLRRLANTVGWELPLVSEIPADELDSRLQQLHAAPGMDVPRMDTRELGNAYPTWVTLITHEPQPGAYSCMHALFIQYVCRARSRSILDFASAIRHRGAVRRAADDPENLLQILDDVEPAENAQDYFDHLYLHSDRIKRIKPHFARVLFEELPDALGLEVPEPNEPIEWQPPTPVSFPRSNETSEETADEQLSPDIFITPELQHPREQPSARTELLRAEQAIRTGNGLWVSSHISCLTLLEAKHVANWLTNFASEATSFNRMVERTGAVLLLLMLATGREVKRAASLLASIDQKDALPRISDDCKKLIQPVLIPKDAYQPKSPARRHLRKVLGHFAVDLPPPLAELLRSWKATTGRQVHPLEQTASIYIVLRKMREDTGIDFTAGRIRHTLACHAYDHCRDPIQVMWITMDNNGHSLAPTHYCAIPESALSTTYSRVCWPIFGQDTEPKVRLSSRLIGSRNQPEDQFLSDGVSLLLRRFNDPTTKATDPRGIAKKHNTMVRYITAMLVVITGHRPAEALFQLTRWDFNLEEGLAIYHDKQSDPSHFYRPVALGSKVSQQLRHYEAHLLALEDRLAEQTGTADLRSQIAQAVAGKSPWFFMLTDELVQCSPTIAQWRRDFEEAFPDIQPNFGRSVIASEWRNPSGGAEHAHLQLGHFSILGLPFEGEGPTIPLAMARRLSKSVDTLWTKQGWRLRKGLGSNLAESKRDHGPRHPAVLRSWEPELTALKEEGNHYRKRVRESRRKMKARARPVAEEIFFKRLDTIHPELSRRIRDYGSRRAEGEVSERCRLTPDQIDRLLYGERFDGSGEECQLNEAVQIALENYANQTLRQAKKARYYSGPIPRRHVIARQRGMTPFFPGMFAATSALDELRQSFFRTIWIVPPTANFTQTDWEFGRLALALAIFAGVESEVILNGLLTLRSKFEANPAANDGILIQISDDPPRVWGLWNVAAAVFLRAYRIIGEPHPPPSRDRLNEILAAMIPDRMVPEQKSDVLGALLQTVSIENRIHLSSLARQALDPELGSWSLPLQRHIALIRNTSDPSEKSASAFLRNQINRPMIVPNRKAVRTIYETVVNQIPSPNRKVRDEQGNLLIPPATWRRYRRRVMSRLRRTIVENEDAPELGRAFALWAIWMLSRARAPGDYVLSEGTVRRYLSLVGPSLLKRMKALSPTVLDDEEFVDLYQEIIAEKSTGIQRATARELVNFHNILVRDFGAPELDTSEFADYLTAVESRVHPELVLPIEALNAMQLFSQTPTGPTPSREYDYRLYTQIQLLYLLLLVTGARLGEIIGLQFRDIYHFDKSVHLRIRPNDFRPTKSTAAKRILQISSALTASERDFLLDWISTEKQTRGSGHATKLIFTNLLDGNPVNRDQLRTPIQVALRSNSPVPLAPKQMRHSKGSRVQLDCALGTRNASPSSRADQPLEFPSDPELSLVLPRELAPFRIWLGHAQLTTTNRSYGHMPWAYLWPSAHQMKKHLDIQALMCIRETTYEATRKYCQRKAEGLSAAVVQSFLGKDRHHSAAMSVENKKSENLALSPPHHLPAARYLMMAPRAENHHQLWKSCGLQQKEATALKRAARMIAQETGIAFFREDVGLAGRARSSAPPKMQNSTERLLSLIDCTYEEPEQTAAIVKSYIAAARPSRRQQIRLERTAALNLKRLIERRCPGYHLELAQTDRISQKCTLRDSADKEQNHVLAWILAIIATIYYAELPSEPIDVA
jgi:integrase